MPRRLTPLEDSPAWDIYRELLRFVHDQRVFPTEHGFYRSRAKPLKLTKTVGSYRYYVERLIIEGHLTKDPETDVLVPRGVTLTFSAEFEALLPSEPLQMPEEGVNPDYVYVLQDKGGLYKIGVSNDPQRRVSEMVVKHPDQVTCVHTIPSRSAFQLEAVLHKHFASKCVSGEWFRLTAHDLAYLRKAGDFLLGRQEPLWLESPSRKRQP